MPEARFVQIHTLHGYTAALLNRDDSGLAKRLPYGGAMRTRISSQCLKRHWRMEVDDPSALNRMSGAEDAYRTRDVVGRLIAQPLAEESGVPEEVVAAIRDEFHHFVYVGKKDKREGSQTQPLLIGAPEVRYMLHHARNIAREANGDARKARSLAEKWRKEEAKNLGSLRKDGEFGPLSGGLTAALFGRFVTSDPEANIDAPIHVAHAFTVHAEESESDYFSVVDDLREPDDQAGAAHINETELTSGLFYGYVVIDVPGLVSNLDGCGRKQWQSSNRDMAGEVVRRLVHLIAEVSPGAKLGSTAPYGYANFVLVEIGDRQPRSLAEAFRTPCPARTDVAEKVLADHLERLDAAYQTGEARRVMSLSKVAVAGAELLSLPHLAEWAGAAVRAGAA